MAVLNGIRTLPIRNLQKTSDPDMEGITGETFMVSCLFARGVYGDQLISDRLRAVGYTALAESIGAVPSHVQKLRWQTGLRSRGCTDADTVNTIAITAIQAQSEGNDS
jgi:hypothetical protein